MCKRRCTFPLKKIICMVLACILLVGLISVGFIAYAPDKNDEREVSDFFYIQLYNSENQVVSKYKVTLTGAVSSTSSEITSVSFSHVLGDPCETDYNIVGNAAVVTVTHPTEGYLDRNFMLSTGGIFSVY